MIIKNTTRVMAALSAAGLALGCAAGDTDWNHDEPAYAEAVYASYAAAAGGNIEFDITVQSAGALVDIAEVPADELLGVPDSWLRMSARGTEITSIQREPRAAHEDEWAGPVDLGELDRLGWSVAEASYRVLGVTARHQGSETWHQALELCWSADGRCLVMDPVVLQLDAFYQDRQRLLAEGWEPVEAMEKASTTCTLVSNRAASGRSITYPAYWIEYRNVFGGVLVRKDMGSQQVGVGCYVSGSSCRSTGYGHSSASSCFGNLGYTCDCDNTGNQIGISTDFSSTRSWSESRCAHRAFLSASASWTIEGVNSGFSINWDTAGSVDSNGGQVYDTCAWN